MGGGPFDLTSDIRGASFGAAVLPGECPVNCDQSVTICGKCYSWSVPGNVALGLFFGYKEAVSIGKDEDARQGKTDDDQLLYAVGSSMRGFLISSRRMKSASRYGGISYGDVPVGDVEKKLYATLNAQHPSIPKANLKSECTPCTHKWSGSSINHKLFPFGIFRAITH